MTERALAFTGSTEGTGKAMAVALWIGQLAVAGILGMAAFTKFFAYTPEGSMALARAMEVGRGVITLIGVVELTAAVLILIPGRHFYGAALAVLTMGGALFAHATKIGWSGNAAAEMWPLALVVLVVASLVAIGRRPRGRANPVAVSGRRGTCAP